MRLEHFLAALGGQFFERVVVVDDGDDKLAILDLGGPLDHSQIALIG